MAKKNVRAKSSEFAAYIHDRLSYKYASTSRRMFGGEGLYIDGRIVGLLIQNELYLKAHERAAQFFHTQGSHPFTYEREGKSVSLKYWQVLEEVLEDEQEFEHWIKLAIESSKEI